MKRLLLTLLCGATLFGQETVSRVVQLHHIHPDGAQAVLDILAAGKVRWRTDGNLRIIAMNGPAELVDAMDAAIKKLDIPRADPPPTKNIEVTFHMLLAAPQGDTPAVPPDLTAVAQQLRNVFGLKSIRVLETAVLRGREGKGALTQGVMAPPGKADPPATYSIRFNNASVSAGEKGVSVRIDSLSFQAKLPLPNGSGGVQYFDASVNTDIDIREGQKVVVGKSSIDSASQSIFLVVTAKVVD